MQVSHHLLCGFTSECIRNCFQISYYNETNPKMVRYVTSDVAGFSKVYSVVYSKMEKYLIDSI